jgi:hypothetical protein
MTCHVYYFTRTGNCERIARKLAERLNCEPYSIRDNVDWQGLGAYFKFQAYAKGKKQLTVFCDGEPAKADVLIVVSPIWGSRLPPTVQKFLAPLALEKVHLVTVSKMDALRGREGYMSIT